MLSECRRIRQEFPVIMVIAIVGYAVTALAQRHSNPPNPLLAVDSIRFELSWDPSQSNLYSYLKTPAVGSQQFLIRHPFHGSLTTLPYDSLKRNDVLEPGRETIIMKGFFPGKYRYYVNRVSGAFTEGTVAHIYRNAILDTSLIPVASTGGYWHVCDVDGTTGGISIVDSMVDIPPGNQLFPIFEGDTTLTDTLAGLAQSVKVGPDTGFQTTRATLYFRRGGHASYDSSALQFRTFDGNYHGIIPSGFATVRGVEFYEAFTGTYRPGGQVTITAPSDDPQTHPFIVQLKLRTIQSAVTLMPRTYGMVSVPMIANDPGIQGVLFDDFGNYDSLQWRLFRWSGTSYSEYPNIRAAFTPGTAFWLIRNAGGSFDVDGGRTVNSAVPYTVLLDTGWNQIANPFAFPVAWNMLAIPDGVIGPYDYDGSPYNLVPVLLPWKGYFVYNHTELSVNLSIPPVDTAGAGHFIAPRRATGGDQFELELKAEVPGTVLKDAHNVVGLAQDAAEGDDRYDFPKPPPIGEGIHVSIVDAGMTFLRNFKPPTGEGQQWDVKVSSDIVVPRVVVTLLSEGRLPDGFQLYVLDKDNFNVVPLQNGSFTLATDGRPTVKAFKIILGTERYASEHSDGIPLVPLEYALDQNFPNPFNPSTTIRFQLASRTIVKLEIFDLLGQRVRTMVHGEQLTGAYSVVWNGDNDAGRPVASGMYLCRLQAGSFEATRKLLILR